MHQILTIALIPHTIQLITSVTPAVVPGVCVVTLLTTSSVHVRIVIVIWKRETEFQDSDLCNRGMTNGDPTGAHAARVSIPLTVQIHSFCHINFTKRSHVGSWHPLQGGHPLLWEILDPPLIRVFPIPIQPNYINLIFK